MGLILFFLLTKPIKFYADSLFYDGKNKILYLYKNVRIEYENITLFSDTLLFYYEKDLIYAFGNAKLKAGKDSLKGDKIIYNTKTQKGKAVKGKTKVEKGFLWAEEIFRVDKNILKAYKGHYTTCDLNPPHYYFVAEKIKIIPKKDIIAEPVFLFIKDFPVLGLPFWIFPATKKRKSGFLSPRPGRNSRLGLYIKNLAYYWAINPYMDYTIGFDLYERKGITFLSNFVYRKYKLLEGNIKGTFTREIEPKRERWSINGIHSQNMPFGARLQAKLDFISDQKYATDYSEYRPQRLKNEAYSYVALSKNFKILSFNLMADYRDNYLTKTKEMTVYNIGLNFYGKSIGPLRVSGSATVLRKIKKDTLGKKEIKNGNLNEGILMQNTLFNFFVVETKVSATQTIYPEDTLSNKFPVQHSLLFSLTSAITFYGTSIIKPPFFDKFYHFATLNFGYSYSPGFKSLHLEGSQPKNPSSSLNFTLKNDYFAKKEKNKYPLLNFSISGNYDFLKKEKKLSNLGINFTIPLPKGFSGGGRAVYNPYSGKIEQSFFRLSFNFPLFLTDILLPSSKKLNSNGTWVYSKRPEKEDVSFSGSISGNITENWSFSYNFVYSGEEKRITSQNLVLNRNLHCFSLQIRWSRTMKFWDYQFRIWIKELPDLKIERNFFETILPSLQE